MTTEHGDFCCTSSATPQVSGAIALLKSAVPNASAAEIRAAIFGSVDQSTGLSGKVMSNGRLNVAKALVRLTNTAALAIVIAAHPAGPGVRPGDSIRVTFSRPMNRLTTEAAIAFTPSIAGRFEWENGDRTVTLIPDGPLARTNHTGRVLRSALDDRGERLDGNFNGVRQDATADDFTWTFGFPVVNDDFADALLISGMTGSKTGTTRNALPEEAEPDIAHERDSAASVWYRWTAPESGRITFDTLKGTVFDTLLGVYIGETISSLTEISSNDNYGGNIRSRTSFAAVAGTTYSIAVAIKAYEANKSILDESRMGSFTLSWSVLRPQLSVRATALGILEITWTAGSVPFALEESETMHGNSWTLVSQIPALENGVFKVALPVSSGQRFFEQDSNKQIFLKSLTRFDQGIRCSR